VNIQTEKFRGVEVCSQVERLQDPENFSELSRIQAVEMNQVWQEIVAPFQELELEKCQNLYLRGQQPRRLVFLPWRVLEQAALPPQLPGLGWQPKIPT
jgi:hypothetical protein